MDNRNDRMMIRLLVKKYALVFTAMFFAAMFQTFSLKANIGVTACWDSIGMNLYEICGLKVGTCSMLLGSVCIAAQCLILRKQFHWTRLLQLPMALLYGWVMNLFYYDIFTFPVTSYGMRVFYCILAAVGMAVFLGITTSINLIPTPAEGLCITISRKYGKDFGKLRLSLDIAAISISLLLSFAFGLSLKAREGTVIGALLLGPLTGICMKAEEKWIPLCRK